MYRHTHRYAYINIVIVAAIALVYFLSTSNGAHSVMAQTASNPVYRVSTAKDAVALVSWYDADPAALESYAQTADSVGIKLNVFVSAEWLAANGGSAGYALSNGHIAGIYGKDIPNDTPPEQIQQMLLQDREQFELYMSGASMFMPNNGEFTKRLSNCVGKTGMRMIIWSKDSRAYACGSAEEFAAEVVKNAVYGDFILVRLDDRLNQALPAMAGLLAEKGWHCATLNDLLNPQAYV